MRISLFWRVLPFYIVTGTLFAVPTLQRHVAAEQAIHASQIAQAKLSKHAPATRVLRGTPVKLLIPSLEIELNVVPGQYIGDSGVWTVSDVAANYVQSSAQLNTEADKTFIYGHATRQVFGKTVELKPGDIVYVYDAQGDVFEYAFTSSRIVAPTDVGVLDDIKGKPGLILMSCDGFYYQDRRLMYFDLVGAS